MSSLVIPVQFASLTSAIPQQLDQNFDAIKNIINGNLDSTNLAFSPATLDGSGLIQQNAPTGFTVGGNGIYYNAGTFQSTSSTCDLGTVYVGDLIFFNAWISFAYTSASTIQLTITKNVGDTAVITPSPTYSPSQYAPWAIYAAIQGQSVVTAEGTLKLSLGYGVSGGTMTAGAMEIDATILRLA